MIRAFGMAACAAFLMAFSAMAQTPAAKGELSDLAYSVQEKNRLFFTGRYQGQAVSLVRDGAVGAGKWTLYTGKLTDRVRLTIDDSKGLEEILALDRGQRMTVSSVGQERIVYRLYAPDRSFIIGSVLYRSHGRWLQGLMRKEAFAGYGALTDVSDVTAKMALGSIGPAARFAAWLQNGWQGVHLMSVAQAQDDGGLFGGFFSPAAQGNRDRWSAPLHEMFKASLAGGVAVAVKLAGQTIATGETVAVGAALGAAAPLIASVAVGVGIGLAADSAYNWAESKNLTGTSSLGDLFRRLTAPNSVTRQPAPIAPQDTDAASGRQDGKAPGPNDLPRAPSSPSLLDMVDKLDSLDQQDFRTALDEAAVCTRNRSFECAESRIEKASKLAYGASDRWLITVARQNMANQKARMAEEAQQLAAQERQRAEEERQRVAQAALQRRQQDEQSQSGGFQWGKAAALLGGSAIGGLGKLSPELQGRVITGILKDSVGGQTGISNFQASTATSATAGTGRTVGAAAAQGAGASAGCGTRGEIIWISDPGEIPTNCQRGRQNNWVTSEERVPNAEQICGNTAVPISDITGKPIPSEKVRNMSGCFCGKNMKASYGVVPLKCWTFYDGAAF